MQENGKTHTLTIRGETAVTGVVRVISVESGEVRLSLGDRDLILTGTGLSAEKLSVEEGSIVLSGEIRSIRYAPKQEAKTFLKKIFK